MAGTEDDPLTGLWLRLAIVTGARRSEILAIRWQDVTDGTVTIAGALELDRRRKATKSGGQRHVRIDAGTVALVEAWRLKAKTRALAVGARLTPTGYVLSDDPAGRTPWRPDLASKRFRRLCLNTGVEGVRLHDLRHAAATTLLAAGVDLATVSARLGHSRSSTTLDVYAHVPRGGDDRAADIAGQVLDSETN
jgi:integrase